jgi:hypothetical protein
MRGAIPSLLHTCSLSTRPKLQRSSQGREGEQAAARRHQHERRDTQQMEQWTNSVQSVVQAHSAHVEVTNLTSVQSTTERSAFMSIRGIFVQPARSTGVHSLIFWQPSAVPHNALEPPTCRGKLRAQILLERMERGET